MSSNTETKLASGTYPAEPPVLVTVIDVSVAGQVKRVAGSRIPVRVSVVMGSAGELHSVSVAQNAIDHFNKTGNTARKYLGSRIPIRKISPPSPERTHVAPTGPAAPSNGAGKVQPVKKMGSKLPGFGKEKLPVVGKGPKLPVVGKGPKLPVVGKGPKIPTVGKESKISVFGKGSKVPAFGKGPKPSVVGKGPKIPAVAKESKIPVFRKGSKVPASEKGFEVPVSPEVPVSTEVPVLAEVPIVVEVPVYEEGSEMPVFGEGSEVPKMDPSETTNASLETADTSLEYVEEPETDSETESETEPETEPESGDEIERCESVLHRPRWSCRLWNSAWLRKSIFTHPGVVGDDDDDDYLPPTSQAEEDLDNLEEDFGSGEDLGDDEEVPVEGGRTVGEAFAETVTSEMLFTALFLECAKPVRQVEFQDAPVPKKRISKVPFLFGVDKTRYRPSSPRGGY